MAQHLTSSSTVATLVADGVVIVNNAALTGTLTVTNGGSTQYGTASGTIAIITNPTAGETHRYNGLRTLGTISVTPNANCDVTVDSLGQGRA